MHRITGHAEIEGLVRLSGKFELGTWSRVHASSVISTALQRAYDERYLC